MRRYRLQNSLRKDYLEQINLLYTHMKARGWQHSLLAEWIMNAADKLEHDLSLPQAETEKEMESDTTCFCSSAISSPRKGTDAEIDKQLLHFPDQEIYAYVRDELTSTRLHQVEGQEASTFRHHSDIPTCQTETIE